MRARFAVAFELPDSFLDHDCALFVVGHHDGRRAGNCDACPHRAGNNEEAKADGIRADVCLNPDCYRAKVEAHDAAELLKGISKGAKPSDSVRTLLAKHLTRDLAAPPAEAAPETPAAQ